MIRVWGIDGPVLLQPRRPQQRLLEGQGRPPVAAAAGGGGVVGVAKGQLTLAPVLRPALDSVVTPGIGHVRSCVVDPTVRRRIQKFLYVCVVVRVNKLGGGRPGGGGGRGHSLGDGRTVGHVIGVCHGCPSCAFPGGHLDTDTRHHFLWALSMRIAKRLYIVNFYSKSYDTSHFSLNVSTVY